MVTPTTPQAAYLAGDYLNGATPTAPPLPEGTFTNTEIEVNANGQIDTVGSGGSTPATIITNGTPVAPGTAQAQPVATIAGVIAGSVASWSLPNAPDATWQTGIAVILVCGAGTVTPYLVNPTAGSITPVAQVLNIRVQL